MLIKRLWFFRSRILNLLFDQLLIPLILRLDRVECLHALANYAILGSSPTQVVTVHDLFQAYPPDESNSKFATKLVRGLYRWHFRAQFSRIAKAFTDCRSVAQELYRRYGFDLGKSEVVPLGLDFVFANQLSGTNRDPIQQEAEPSAARTLPASGFVLAHVSLDPRKNLQRTLQAWNMLSAEEKARGLVLLGVNSKNRSSVESLLGVSLAKLGVSPAKEIADQAPNIWTFEQVSRKQLAELYRRSAVVLVPTLAEGFGYPVIEALATGSSVVSAELESIKGSSLIGTRIFICNPQETASIKTSLESALTHATRSSLGVQLTVQPKRNGHPRPRTMDDVFAVYADTYKMLLRSSNRQ